MLQLIPGGGLKQVEDDTTPVLGGNLDGGGYDISNVGLATLGALTVDSPTFYIDDVNHRVAVGTTTFSTATVKFEIAGVSNSQVVIRDSVNPSLYLYRGLTPMGRWYTDGIYFNMRASTGKEIKLAANNASSHVMINVDGDVGVGTITQTAKLDINSDILRLRTPKTPATAGAAGNQGDICWDASYIYVCIATDTWRRSFMNIW